VVGREVGGKEERGVEWEVAPRCTGALLTADGGLEAARAGGLDLAAGGLGSGAMGGLEERVLGGVEHLTTGGLED